MNNNARKRTVNKINIVLSLLIAFAAWMYVVYNVHPTINKKFKDVPITFVGQYELAEKGYGIDSVEKIAIDVTLKVNRRDLSKISEENISVQADVSETSEGDNNIQINVNVPKGASVKSQELNIVTVNVKPILNKNLMVIAQISDKSSNSQGDDMKEPWIDSVNYKEVSAYGTASNLKKAEYAAVYYDITTLDTTPKEMKLSPVAVDSSFNAVPFITIFPSEIQISAHKASIKKVPLEVTVRNDVDDSTGRTYYAPSYVYIKGFAKDISSITSITTEEIDLSNMASDTEIDIPYNLPDGFQIANKSLGKKIQVKVKH